MPALSWQLVYAAEIAAGGPCWHGSKRPRRERLSWHLQGQSQSRATTALALLWPQYLPLKLGPLRVGGSGEVQGTPEPGGGSLHLERHPLVYTVAIQFA